MRITLVTVGKIKEKFLVKKKNKEEQKLHMKI